MSTTQLIAASLRSPPRRYTRQPYTSPGGTEGFTFLLHPNENELNSNLEQTVLHLREDIRPGNTAKTQDPKVKEYFQFCDIHYGHDPYKYNLDCNKVYRFMYYQCFREQRKKGGTKAERAARAAGHFFDNDEYEAVMAHFRDGPRTASDLPQPEKPISYCTVSAYKAVFRKIYKVQIAKKVLSLPWDQIWQMCFDDLVKHVKERVPLRNKANYVEKVDGEFAPYMMVENYSSIEAMMWEDADQTGLRSICCALRHRYCALHLTSGILRCESIYRAEFSDFLGIFIPKQETDVHQPYVMINQIPIGKTTHGRKQYGRATRHKDVLLCCIGAFSFYVQFRLMCTNEFAEMQVEDWLDNKKWFDVKVLVDVSAADFTKEMKNDSYEKHIKSVLRRLNLNMNKILHLGRNIGSRILELLEAETPEINRMGQWSEGVQGQSYSAKMPMAAMRKLAGFPGKFKCYFNTRTSVDPPEELLLQTPIGKWVYEAYDAVTEAGRPGKHMTAISFLRFFIELNKIFLQDAAATIALHPERENHGLFQKMPCFLSDTFKVSDASDAFACFCLLLLFLLLASLSYCEGATPTDCLSVWLTFFCCLQTSTNGNY
jgi:Centromere DNA-binding protein complex CBF3 subunit, domain 2